MDDKVTSEIILKDATDLLLAQTRSCVHNEIRAVAKVIYALGASDGRLQGAKAAMEKIDELEMAAPRPRDSRCPHLAGACNGPGSQDARRLHDPSAMVCEWPRCQDPEPNAAPQAGLDHAPVSRKVDSGEPAVAASDVLNQVEKALRKNPLLSKFLDVGFWDAHWVNLTIRHNGKDIGYEGDWIKDIWNIVIRRGLSATGAVRAAQQSSTNNAVDAQFRQIIAGERPVERPAWLDHVQHSTPEPECHLCKSFAGPG